MGGKIIDAKVKVLNMPNKPLKTGYMVARVDITAGKSDLWYYGLYDSYERANAAAVEIRNGVVLGVLGQEDSNG